MPVFSILDIITIIITGLFVIIGIWKGFLKTVLKFGAAFFAVIIAKLFGGRVGLMILPEVIKSDSGIGSKLSEATLLNINTSIATIIGTALLFIVLFIILRIIAGIVAKAVVGGLKSKGLDRILGAVLGFVLSVGAMHVVALIVNFVAVIMTFINPSSDIYAVIDRTVFFRFFF